jgi:uncharacterized protein (TIGR02391 family)
MKVSIKTLFHPRIEKHCEKLFDDGHYKDVAARAMTQVELAVKEYSGITDKYGTNLMHHVFGKDKEERYFQLRVPFGETLQKAAESFFAGTFRYYRNYAVHDGSMIDKGAAIRIMIIASELLELIGASRLSFRDSGGIEGLVKSGVFPSEESVMNLLESLDGYICPAIDGLWEELAENGFTDKHVHFLIDLGLVEFTTKQSVPNALEETSEELYCFELTNQGRTLVKEEE